jgi:hypothetical protein
MTRERRSIIHCCFWFHLQCIDIDDERKRKTKSQTQTTRISTDKISQIQTTVSIECFFSSSFMIAHVIVLGNRILDVAVGGAAILTKLFPGVCC